MEDPAPEPLSAKEMQEIYRPPQLKAESGEGEKQPVVPTDWLLGRNASFLPRIFEDSIPIRCASLRSSGA
jgi:hypothetical protein